MNPVTAALLNWYDQNARVMPWRGIQDPYRTWVSEAMLQQTRVDTVLSYYDRFLERFPDLESLARADEEDVLKAWEGLGYYSRARNLWLGARQVLREYGGQLPSDPERLVRIRGIGPYTAGAIASIAFQEPVPAVDGNVIRVLSRLFLYTENPLSPSGKKKMEAAAARLVPPERPGDHNQAMMDLGATVCTPGTPDCRKCPLTAFCKACAEGCAADLPRLPQARPPRVIHYDLLLILSDGRILMRQRTEKLLQGLWCFPMLEQDGKKAFSSADTEKKMKLSLPEAREAGSVRHVFTHRIWEMRLEAFTLPADVPAPPGYKFIPLGQLNSLPIPAAMNGAMDYLRILMREA